MAGTLRRQTRRVNFGVASGTHGLTLDFIPGVHYDRG